MTFYQLSLIDSSIRAIADVRLFVGQLVLPKSIQQKNVLYKKNQHVKCDLIKKHTYLVKYLTLSEVILVDIFAFALAHTKTLLLCFKKDN